MGSPEGASRFRRLGLDLDLTFPAPAGLHFNPARLGRLRDRKRQMQYPVGVGCLNILRIHRVAQLQLSGEASLRPLRDKHAHGLLVFGATLCADRQDVPLSGDLHAGRINAGQVERDMKSVIGLPHIHWHPHRGPSTRQQLVRQPIHLPERITEWVESQHTHGTPP